MPKAGITIKLDEKHLTALRKRAEVYRLSLAELIRQAIDDGLPTTLERLSTKEATLKTRSRK